MFFFFSQKCGTIIVSLYLSWPATSSSGEYAALRGVCHVLALWPLHVRVEMLLQLVLPGEHPRAKITCERSLPSVNPSVSGEVWCPRERQSAQVTGERLVLLLARSLHVSAAVLLHVQLLPDCTFGHFVRALWWILYEDKGWIFEIKHGFLKISTMYNCI